MAWKRDGKGSTLMAQRHEAQKGGYKKMTKRDNLAIQTYSDRKGELA